MARVKFNATKSYLEQAIAEKKAAAEHAAAKVQEEKDDAEELKRRKGFCTYLIIFFLHFHACSVRSIFLVLQSYDLESTESDISSCIEDNRLFTHKDVLPDDNGEQSIYSVNETPEFCSEKIHSKQFRLTVTHPHLPAVWSAGLVLTQAPDGWRIVTQASRTQLVFTIFCARPYYPFGPLNPHYRRCMERAVGLIFAPEAFSVEYWPADFYDVELLDKLRLECWKAGLFSTLKYRYGLQVNWRYLCLFLYFRNSFPHVPIQSNLPPWLGLEISNKARRKQGFYSLNTFPCI